MSMAAANQVGSGQVGQVEQVEQVTEQVTEQVEHNFDFDKALIAKPEWSARLMSKVNPKTWELRNGNTKIRGKVGIMASGQKELLGEAVLVNSFPLTQELYEQNMGKHQTVSTTGCWEDVAGRYKKPHVWVFEDGKQNFKQYSEPNLILFRCRARTVQAPLSQFSS